MGQRARIRRRGAGRGGPRLPRGPGRARASARDRADGRLECPGGRVRRSRRAGAGGARRARRPRGGRRAGRAGRCGRARRPWSSARASPTSARGRRSSRSPSGSAARCGRRRSAAVRASRRITRSSPGTCPRAAARLRETLRGRDAVLVVGGAALKQYLYEPGPLVDPGTRVAVLTSNPPKRTAAPRNSSFWRRSPTRANCWPVRSRQRPAEPIADWRRPAPPRGGPLRAGHVLDGLAQRLSADTIVIEEAPSSRPELIDRIVVREPRRFISTAMGGLGFAIPAAVGLRMAEPRQPGRRDRRRRLGDLLHPGAVERRALRRRRGVRGPLQRRLRDHGSPRAGERAGRAVAGLRDRSTSLRSRPGSGARRCRSRPTRN